MTLPAARVVGTSLPAKGSEVGLQTASTTTAAHFFFFLQNAILGTYLVVQWLRLHTSTARGMGLIRGWGTKILYATQHDQENKRPTLEQKVRKMCITNKFS